MVSDAWDLEQEHKKWIRYSDMSGNNKIEIPRAQQISGLQKYVVGGCYKTTIAMEIGNFVKVL